MFGACPPEPSDPSPCQDSDSKLVVAKAVRAFLKGLPLPVKCGAEVITAIDDRLRRLLLEAASRAQDNGRKTLKIADL
jgi:hypothetical protein